MLVGRYRMGSTQEFAESLETEGSLVHTHPLTDRRRAARHPQKYVTQMTPWCAGHPSIPRDVVIDDLSETGAGVIADERCAVGMRHLLVVPREGGEKPIVREYNVIRCERRADGKYDVGLELIVGLTAQDSEDDNEMPERKPVTSSRLKLLFLAFGLVCLLVAFFVPL